MFGTLSILDQLSLIKTQTAIEYGETRLLDDFNRFLAVQNARVAELTSIFIEDTTDRLSSYGIGSRIEMGKADEFGRSDAQKTFPSTADIGWPLDLFQASLQWTRRFLLVAPVSELATQMKAVEEADMRAVRREIQRALFTPTNRLSYKDRFVDNATLPVRALFNADSAPIPEDDYGNVFDGSTHNHYVGTGSLTAANITALVNNVAEHGVSSSGNMKLYINRAQEAVVKGFTDNFDAYGPLLINPGPGSTADQIQGNPRLDVYNIYDRPIGIWDGAVEVWVKPWVFPSYIVCIDEDPQKKVLRRRYRTAVGLDLQLVAEDEKYPLRARTVEREFGMGVWNRDKAAILYTANSTYAAPTIV